MCRKHFAVLYLFFILKFNSGEYQKGYFSARKQLVTDDSSEADLGVHSRQKSGFDLTDQEMDKFKIWKDGVIPYFIDVTSYSDKVLRDQIRGFLSLVNTVTPLTFMELPVPPEDTETRWVFFVNRRGQLACGDHSVKNFNNTGVQRVTLGYDCMNSQGELGEAVLAIAGVPAQHNSPDRDEHIKVNMENVLPDKVHLFEKLNDNEWLFHDLHYDYASVGHYDSFKYSAHGKAVIEPLDKTHTPGENNEFSQVDLMKIRMLYNFISKKKRLNLSECEKLFEKKSSFEHYEILEPHLKPIKKPVKYLGTDPGGPSEEYEQFVDDYNEHLKPDATEVVPTVDEDTKAVDNNDVQLTNDTELALELTNDTPDAEIDSTAENSGIQKTKLKSEDPLAYLSDYSSDEEGKRKEKVKKVKGKTLDFVSKKQRLLFGKG